MAAGRAMAVGGDSGEILGRVLGLGRRGDEGCPFSGCSVVSTQGLKVKFSQK
jgi:hypothetical protein